MNLPIILTGKIIHGKGLGRTVGMPTANLRFVDMDLLPEEGVYAGIAVLEDDSRRYVTILNQGHHPTAPGGMPTVEAHLLGHPDIPLYGRRLTLIYRAFLRPENTFSSLEALRNQLELDRRSALAWAQEHEPQLI